MFKLFFLTFCANFFAFVCVNGDECGTPGNSRFSYVEQFVERKQFKFLESSKVKYKCFDYENHTIISLNERICLNGTWSGSIPLCVKRYIPSEDPLFTIVSSQIEVEFYDSISLVGFEFRINGSETKSVRLLDASVDDPFCERDEQ
ncbi:hypothetical protein B4U79_19073, partial [Dinothrombium tinctorium]